MNKIFKDLILDLTQLLNESVNNKMMSLISTFSLRKNSDVSIRHLCKFVLICRERASKRASNSNYLINLMYAAFYDSNH